MQAKNAANEAQKSFTFWLKI